MANMIKRYGKCESAEDGLHKFSPANHTRAAPCLECGEARDILKVRAKPPTLRSIIQLQLATLSAAEQNLNPHAVSIVISNRMTRDWYLRKTQKWKAVDIRMEVTKQLMRAMKKVQSFTHGDASAGSATGDTNG